ncbi:MAG: NUDIX hydrolase [Nonomuraea sp.]|nr:NUDIX hydrolase [Nonomuraea sp.]
MTEVVASCTVPWIPVEHRLDMILSSALPPADRTTSAFAFVSDDTGRTLLTCVDVRGWDVPGGHVEPGESATEAAARELQEETGLLLEPSALSVFAWQRVELLGPAPAGYRYGSLSYMAMFRARLAGPGGVTSPPAGSESTAAEWLSRARIRELCADRTWLPLLERV